MINKILSAIKTGTYRGIMEGNGLSKPVSEFLARQYSYKIDEKLESQNFVSGNKFRMKQTAIVLFYLDLLTHYSLNDNEEDKDSITIRNNLIQGIYDYAKFGYSSELRNICRNKVEEIAAYKKK